MAATKAGATGPSRLSRSLTICAIALVVLGVGIRVASFWTQPLGIDANRYAVMGESWSEDRTFTMPWGDVYSPGSGPQPSHHYPPVYPVFLGLAYEVMGFSEATTRVAAITASLLAIAVTFLCTRDLYGKGNALLATAVIAVSPLHVFATQQGYSENLLLALFAGTLWAILKSLERPSWILLAGLLAGISYLTRSSVGLFFVVAGLGGLAWRLRWHGWKTFRNPWYLAAIAVFGAFAGTWGWRNWYHFGTWQTSSHTAEAYRHALAEPWTWLGLTLVCFAFLAVVGYLALMGMLPWLRTFRGIAGRPDEHSSALLLAMGLPLLLAAPIDSALWMYEDRFFFLNVRYVSIALVPATWLVLRHIELRPSPSGPGTPRASRRAVAVSIGLLLAGTVGFAVPRESPAPKAAAALGDQLRDGETVAFVGVRDVYRYYFALTDDGRRDVQIQVLAAEDAHLATADWAISPPGVVLQEPYDLHSQHGWTEGPVPKSILVWQRS